MRQISELASSFHLVGTLFKMMTYYPQLLFTLQRMTKTKFHPYQRYCNFPLSFRLISIQFHREHYQRGICVRYVAIYKFAQCRSLAVRTWFLMILCWKYFSNCHSVSVMLLPQNLASRTYINWRSYNKTIAMKRFLIKYLH